MYNEGRENGPRSPDAPPKDMHPGWVRAIRRIWLWFPPGCSSESLGQFTSSQSTIARPRPCFVHFLLSLHCQPALDFPPFPSHSLQDLSQSSHMGCHPLPPQAFRAAELLIMPRQSSGSSHTLFSLWPGCPLLPSLNGKLLHAFKTRTTT